MLVLSDQEELQMLRKMEAFGYRLVTGWLHIFRLLVLSNASVSQNEIDISGHIGTGTNHVFDFGVDWIPEHHEILIQSTT